MQYSDPLEEVLQFEKERKYDSAIEILDGVLRYQEVNYGVRSDIYVRSL